MVRWYLSLQIVELADGVVRNNVGVAAHSAETRVPAAEGRAWLQPTDQLFSHEDYDRFRSWATLLRLPVSFTNRTAWDFCSAVNCLRARRARGAGQNCDEVDAARQLSLGWLK